jgi:hypothetical protein
MLSKQPWTHGEIFRRAGSGLAAALNRKIIEIARQNVSSGFDLARSLATAKTLPEILELRATYWRKQLTALAAQAEEVRGLSAKVAADMAAPIQAHDVQPRRTPRLIMSVNTGDSDKVEASRGLF